MSRIQSLEDLAQAKIEARERQQTNAQICRFQVRISTASCGVAVGALDTLKTFHDLVSSKGLEDVCIKQIGCLGLCAMEPVVQVQEADHAQITYGKVTREVAQRIMQEHLGKGLIVQENVIELI